LTPEIAAVLKEVARTPHEADEKIERFLFGSRRMEFLIGHENFKQGGRLLMKIEAWLEFLKQRWEEIVATGNGSSSDQMIIFTVISLILFILAIAILWFRSPKRRARKRWKRMRKEAKIFLRDMKARKKAPIVPVNVILKEGEVGILQEPSMLYETRASRLDHGQRRGRESSNSHPRLKHVDSGRIILTNRRLIFDGQWENSSTNLHDVQSARPLEDAVEISTGRKSQIYAVGNPLLWAKAIEIFVSGKVTVQQDEAEGVAPVIFNRRDF
jgi:hypothetical protein